MTKKKVTDAIYSTDPQTSRWKSLFASGRMAYDTGEFRQAETLLARAMEIAHTLPERKFAENTTLIGTAAIQLAQKRWKEASKALDKAINNLEGEPGENEKELLAVAYRFRAQAMMSTDNLRDAEKELQKSVAILEKLGPDAVVQLSYSLSDTCALLLMSGREKEAEHHIIKAMQLISNVLGTDNPEYTRADMIYQLSMPMDDATRMETVSDSIQRMQYAYGGKHPNITRALDRYLKALEDRGAKEKIEEVTAKFGAKAGR